jgi:hypothetical protein
MMSKMTVTGSAETSASTTLCSVTIQKLEELNIPLQKPKISHRIINPHEALLTLNCCIPGRDHLHVGEKFLDAFAKLQKSTISFVMSRVCRFLKAYFKNRFFG